MYILAMRNSLPGAGFVMCCDISAAPVAVLVLADISIVIRHVRASVGEVLSRSIGDIELRPNVESGHDSCALALTCQALNQHLAPETIRNEPNDAAKNLRNANGSFGVVLVEPQSSTTRTPFRFRSHL